MNSYMIVYDINIDIDNWYGALNDTFEGFGFQWIDNVKNESDREIANKIVGLDKESGRSILTKYLNKQIKNPSSRLNKYIEIAENDFKIKYNDACKVLEKITGHKMAFKEITFYITTFPRVQYNYEKNFIMMYISTEGFWGMPIDNFLHEGLHFQFTKYWRNNRHSQISKMDEDKFHYLKEALSIVLDEDTQPIATIVDHGYSSQAKYCKALHLHWRKHHNFNLLVNYGNEILDKYY